MKFKEDDVEILKGVLEESSELLKGLEDKLIMLEQTKTKESVNDVFRVFHSLKGLAGFANLSLIVDVTHAVESILKRIRDEGAVIKPELIDLLLDAADFCKIVFDKIAATLSTYSGGELELMLEDLGEKEIVDRANSYFEEKQKEPQQPQSDQPSIVTEEFSREAFSDFLDELEENLHGAEITMVELEKSQDVGLLRDLMRYMHSIKGGARLLLSICGDSTLTEPVKSIERISHALEDQIQRTIKENAQMDLQSVFEGIDVLKKLASALRTGSIVEDKEIEALFAPKEISATNVEQGEEESVEDLATKEAFFNIASQLVQYAEFLIETRAGDRTELRRIAEPLKAGLLMIGHPEKIELVDKMIEAGESDDFQRLKALADEFLSWLSGKKVAADQVSQPITSQTTPEKVVAQTVRVNKSKLDLMVNLVGELITLKNSLKYFLAAITSRLPELQSDLKALSMRFERLSYDFQTAVLSLRMTPVGELFQRYKRTVRDLAKSLNKRVSLVTEGEDVELDRSVLELLSDPLTHLVRNAVDHGIEPPEERKRLGKNEEGKVVLRAFYKGNFAFVEVEDDGRGIDVSRVRMKAIDRGIVDQEEALRMSDEQVLQLIFLPGFSTAERVTDLSGRGVGMDVVKTNIESIGGKVAIRTELGKGSTVSMMIPLSLMAIKGLLVKIGEEKYIIPTDTVKEILKVPLNRLYSYRGSFFANIRGDAIPVVFAEELLTQDHVELSQKQFLFDLVPILVVQGANSTFGVIVDAFLEESDYLVKSVPEQARASNLISGATVMGDGSVVLILNPEGLIT